MDQLIILTVLLVFFSGAFGADQDRPNNFEKKQPVFLPLGDNRYPSDFQYNFLEPQYQYSSAGGFNYIPQKQPSFPRSQPPLIFFAGNVPPGQQFLLQQPGAPPGNFLIPQPEGPNFILRGNPNQQTPLFTAGYPKPAHIPPIEKDAEEVPNLAGNHPGTTGPSFPARRPEKLETLDEPQPQEPTEVEELAPADKNPGGFPKKYPAPQPRLRPGQRFFILNGHPLYSNYPLDQQFHNQFQTTSNPETDVVYYRQQPQFIQPPQPQNQNRQVPVQDLFLRNPVTGEISDVRTLPAAAFEQGNIIALNQPADFREQGFFLRNTIPAALVAVPTKNSKSAETRLGKSIQLVGQPALLQSGQFLPSYGDGYYFSDLRNGKEEDDTVIIDAKVQDEPESDEIRTTTKKEEAEASLSQAQPAAIAIAGTGGIASAGPRGTALVGPKGLAVSSPQATAIAGPKNEDENEQDKKTKPKKEKL